MHSTTNLQCMCASCTSHTTKRHHAHARLHSLAPLFAFADAPGFVRALAEIATSRDVTPAPRLLGMLLLKSLVERHWRAGAPTDTLPAADRAAIQERLLTAPHEPDDAVATQEALVVGKIARVELPQGWPELMPCVLESIRGAQVRACEHVDCDTSSVNSDPPSYTSLTRSAADCLRSLAFALELQFIGQSAGVGHGHTTRHSLQCAFLNSTSKHSRCKAPVVSVGSL